MPTFSTFGQQHIKISDGALAEFVDARIQELARQPGAPPSSACLHVVP